MKHFKYILFIIVLLSQSCSFSAKENYLDDFTAFVSEVEKNYTSLSPEDWEIKDEELKQFTENKFDEHRKALTDEDKKAIGKLVGRYSVVRAKGYGKQFKDGINDAKNYIEGFLEGFSDEIKQK
ncbi:MAG: hypothetical protein GX273_10160 [Bacteroidales bacterium]|nr:hypothetical protein [Bacteroidales bacterium]